MDYNIIVRVGEHEGEVYLWRNVCHTDTNSTVLPYLAERCHNNEHNDFPL